MSVISCVILTLTSPSSLHIYLFNHGTSTIHSGKCAAHQKMCNSYHLRGYHQIKFERDTFLELRALTSSGSSGPKYNCCPYLALLTFIYHYLPIFGLFRLNYPYLGIFAPNYPDFTICAIYTLYNVFFY